MVYLKTSLSGQDITYVLRKGGGLYSCGYGWTSGDGIIILLITGYKGRVATRNDVVVVCCNGFFRRLVNTGDAATEVSRRY